MVDVVLISPQPLFPLSFLPLSSLFPPSFLPLSFLFPSSARSGAMYTSPRFQAQEVQKMDRVAKAAAKSGNRMVAGNCYVHFDENDAGLVALLLEDVVR